MTVDPDIMNVEDAAKFLRVSRNQLYEAIGRGEVPHRRIGKIIRLSRAALVRWLDVPLENRRASDNAILRVNMVEARRFSEGAEVTRPVAALTRRSRRTRPG